ncbi:MAG: thiamine diphosphokinase [Chloroflexi bacterium]|nr:thiamine diphosphokinase [Chloroflexota bacterium]
MRILIVANAPVEPDSRMSQLANTAAYIIAADGGAVALHRAGIRPHILIGDLDSLTDAHVTMLAESGTQVRRFRRDKDETDLELALNAAVELGATHIDLCCVLGGRWDHTFATIALLTQPSLTQLHVSIYADNQILQIVHDTVHIEGEIGHVVSLLPLTPEVTGITTTGLQYPLHAATLYFDRSRGVSNVIMHTPASVHIASGILLIVRHNSTLQT